MTTRGKHVFATTTVTPARVLLFQPTQRPTFRHGEWLSTPWGRCRVVGRLGQRHADVLEAMLFNAEKGRSTPDGAVELLTDPAAIRSSLSDSRHSGQRLQAWLDELMSVVIEIDTPSIRVAGHLIDHVRKSTKTRHNPFGGERNLWVVRLGIPLVELLRNDHPLHYDPAPLSRLDHGISQAVARHLLTHTKAPNGGWKLDSLIRAVSGDINPQALRDRRREIRACAEQLAALGIHIRGDRVCRGKGLEQHNIGTESASCDGLTQDRA